MAGPTGGQDNDPNNPLALEDWVKQVMKSEKLPKAPESVVVLWGYLGDAEHFPPPQGSSEDKKTDRESYRLYTSLMLNEYIEILATDIIHSKHLANDKVPLGGTILWIKPNATVQYVRAETLQVRAGFLQGPIMGGMGMAQGNGGQYWQQGGLSLACNGGGLTLACNGGGLTLACNGGGLTLACNGGGLTLACNGGGLTLACNGGGASFVCR